MYLPLGCTKLSKKKFLVYKEEKKCINDNP